MAIDTSLEPVVAPADGEPRAADAHSGGGLRRTVRQVLMALADQSTISGVRFITTVIVGRACGPEELGIYSLGFALLLVFSCAHESLIFTPLVVYGSRLQGNAQREYSGGVLGVTALVVLVAIVSLGALGLILMGMGRFWLGVVLMTLTLAAPASLAREFCRWFSLARRRLDQALVLDVTFALFQSGFVLVLGWRGALSAGTAYVAITAVCAVNAACWFFRAQSEFILRREQMVPVLTRHWTLARWIVASQAVNALVNPAILWILAAFINVENAGRLTACMTVVLLYNPILLGINNFFFPRAVQSLLRGGPAALRRTVWKHALIFGGGVVLVAGPMMVFGEQLIRLIYGSAYTDQRAVIMLLGLIPVATVWWVVIYGGLCALERTNATFAASLTLLLVSVGAALVLVPFWGLNGAACSLLVGPVACVLVCGFIFQAATAPATAGKEGP
jgi:O-antigen/teichoic acid export membrane protein